MKLADADVENYLRMFTILSMEEIDQIVETHMVNIIHLNIKSDITLTL